MIDRLLGQKLEGLLISPRESQDFLVGVARLDSLGEEAAALLEEPEEAGKEALGPGGCHWENRGVLGVIEVAFFVV